MRIALIGQAAFGDNVLKALAEAREELAVVYMPRTRPAAKPTRSAKPPKLWASPFASQLACAIGGIRGVQDLRGRPERHGFRHRHRPE